jgi:glycosyltransferase involved in cell wall biosynthesis
MERAVIDTFDLLQPEVEPHFLISQTPKRLGLPVFDEIERRKFSYTFLSDKNGWERLAKPRSMAHLWRMLTGVVKGNVDTLKAIRHHEALYIPNLFATLYALGAIIFCRLTRRRVIYHFHDLIRYRAHALRLLSPFVTHFVHNTELGLAETIAHNEYILKKPNFVIPSPVGMTSDEADDPSVTEAFAGNFNLIFAGRVSRSKGIEVLLEAFSVLRSVDKNVVLHIVGGCDDPTLLDLLNKSAADSDLRIKYWGYRQNITPMLKLADIYVHPTLPSLVHESFGRGVVEAMAVGLPSVCFPSGALQEIVVSEQTGLICHEESAESLAVNLRRLMTDHDLRKFCAESARERYAALYANNKVKEGWQSLLSDML